MSDFAHLHVHSMYSLLEASCRPKDLAKKASEMGMSAIALTDNGNMFGAIEFYNYCREKNVKPLLGLDAYIAPKSRHSKGEDRDVSHLPNRRIVLLATNFDGYQELCRISSVGYQEGFYWKPRIDYDVLRANNKNIIALTGGLRGEVPYHFLNHGPEKALEKIRELKEIYSDKLYLEMCRTNVPEWAKLNEFLLEASKICSVPVVASNDVHYIYQEDSMAQEVLMCVGGNKTLQDESRFRMGSDEFYLKSPEQMTKLFKDVPEAVANTLEIASRCDVKFKLKDETGHRIYHLPNYPTTDGRTIDEEIQILCREGLRIRITEGKARGEVFDEAKLKIYNDRLNYELGVIAKMGFNGYFLIVADFIGWAKAQDIPVGPGRGSGAGSLVAYSLRITDLDPMPYNLIFERFLNPERISMPDFDVDFCQDRRGEVIQYVTQKYGPEYVSQIITFGKLQARAAVRDVGRVLGMTMQEVSEVVDLIPDKLGISLHDAIEEEDRLKDRMESDPKINTLMELSQKVEGLTRHASIHAAGVIIANRPLVEYAPLYKGSGNETVVQYDMKNAEGMGLIKFDFLGLKTLTMIQDALHLIEKNRGKKITTSNMLLDDAGVYDLMSTGDLLGIFQFEGSGITEFTKRAKPTCFEDITAINALYRPGPMQFIDEYRGRKHGEIKVSYLFPELEEILKETYGIIVYQEHVQLIAAKIASYSLGEADLLRRAMGKKIASEMAQQKDRFMSGALKNGFDEKKAGELFDQMAKFAEYGFNKSHAAAYCVVAVQTAWLKRYYPVEFFAALNSTELSNTDKILEYVKDARDHGIVVRPPHINYSDSKFSVSGEEIFFGLAAIKGVGESAVEAIIEARNKMPEKKFASLEDFFETADLRRINKKVVECLIKAGALDNFGLNRAQLMATYPKFIDYAEVKQKDLDMGQVSLFSLDPMAEEKVPIPDLKDWPKAYRLACEKEVLALYLSDHPLRGIESLLKPIVSTEISKILGTGKKQRVVLGGLLESHRELITRKGTRMSFAQLEDLGGKIELVTFPDIYAKVENIFKQDLPVIVTGVYDLDKRGEKIVVENIETLEERLRRTKRIQFRLTDKYQDLLPELKDLMLSYPGTSPVSIHLSLAHLKREVLLELDEPKGVQPSTEFFDKVYELLGNLQVLELH